MRLKEQENYIVKNLPLLTVLVPCYNAENFLFKALNSIQKQSFKNFICIIIDDCSTDKTVEIIKTFLSDSRFKLIENETNLGKPKSINNQLHQVKSKYLTIHDADDYSDINRFQNQIYFLEQNPSFVMCGTSFIEVDEYDKELKTITPETDYQKIKKEIYSNSQFHGPTLMFHSDIPKKIGGLFRYMKMGEDIDFTMRVVENYHATNILEPLYYYRINRFSITKNYRHDIKSKIIDRQLIQRLANERKINNKDCLMIDDQKAFQNHIISIEKEYEDKKDDYLDEYLGYLLHFNMKKEALKTLIYRSYKDGLSYRKIKMLKQIIFK